MFMPRPKRQPYTLYGVAMLSVVALLSTLSIMTFKQVFKSSTPVTMRISRAGLQLLNGSDVKMKGLIVGDVKSIDSTGNGAIIKLELNPKYTNDIPENVLARLIPKTVFGEKYIDLVPPSNPSPVPIKAGGTIAEDRTTPALEIDQALNDLLPLLRTVRPQDLNSTLSAMASALSGRGEKLGQTTIKLENYFKQLNPHLPQIQHDFQALAGVATTYDKAAPALLAILRNFTVTGDTFTAKAATFSAFLKDVTGTALVTRDFLARNAQNIVQVNVVSRSTLALLAEYSPEYDCLFKGMANLVPKIKATKATKHTANVMVEFHGAKPAYTYPLDYPEFNDVRGPACYGLPNPASTLPTIQFADGTEDDPRFAKRNGHTDAQGLNASAAGKATPLASMGDAGTADERAGMNVLLGPIMGRPASKVPGVADLLWGPMVRGTLVDLK